MSLRPDKCTSFGMAKIKGSYNQIEPKLFIDGTPIPSVKIGDHFKYLGKLFSFKMDNQDIKEELTSTLKNLLEKYQSYQSPFKPN